MHQRPLRSVTLLIASTCALTLLTLGPGSSGTEATTASASTAAGTATSTATSTASSPPSTVAADAAPRSHPGREPRCRSGKVALTFDDGPNPAVTPDLVRLLEKQHVPATFFMVGSRVDAAPAVAAMVARHGFAIGNHTYAHHDLTTLGAAQIRHGIARTRAALRRAGVRHVSSFVRPPYGAVDAQVRTTLRGLGLTTVLWNVDSRDWDGLASPAIVRSVVAQVRAHGRAGSVVLQHDGVTNSPATLAALPREIRTLRRAGYCFTGLGADGYPD